MNLLLEIVHERLDYNRVVVAVLVVADRMPLMVLVVVGTVVVEVAYIVGVDVAFEVVSTIVEQGVDFDTSAADMAAMYSSVRIQKSVQVEDRTRQEIAKSETFWVVLCDFVKFLRTYVSFRYWFTAF